MAYWLLKTEPSTYSFDDLVREKQTVWEGVKNPTALIHLRSMRKNDLALVYHTGSEKQVVGIAKVASAPYADPKQKNEKLVVVDLKADQRLNQPVTLDAIKAEKTFAGWDLLKIGRLSVVPVPEKMWNKLLAMSEKK